MFQVIGLPIEQRFWSPFTWTSLFLINVYYIIHKDLGSQVNESEEEDETSSMTAAANDYADDKHPRAPKSDGYIVLQPTNNDKDQGKFCLYLIHEIRI